MEYFSPVILTFSIIVIGFYIGKIKIFNISLDLAAVLICAVAIGYVISIFYSENSAYILSLTSLMKNLTSIGTAIFVSAVGISAGYCLFDNFNIKNILYFLCGALMVCIGFISMKCITVFDDDISNSCLKGILCGALTSTPGMSSACELDNAIPEEVTLGYGSAYLFGVIFIVLFVQILIREEKFHFSNREVNNLERNLNFEFFIQIAISAAAGSIIGNISLPFIYTSLGSSGGILCAGIVTGAFVRRFFPCKVNSMQSISVFRNIGLVFFFVGSGVPAGLKLKNSFQIKWIMYGIILTVIPIFIGYIVCRILKYGKVKTGFITAGGMTSTPAAGVLINKCSKVDLSPYSISYFGALITMVIGIRLF